MCMHASCTSTLQRDVKWLICTQKQVGSSAVLVWSSRTQSRGTGKPTKSAFVSKHVPDEACTLNKTLLALKALLHSNSSCRHFSKTTFRCHEQSVMSTKLTYGSTGLSKQSLTIPLTRNEKSFVLLRGLHSDIHFQPRHALEKETKEGMYKLNIRT